MSSRYKCVEVFIATISGVEKLNTADPNDDINVADRMTPSRWNASFTHLFDDAAGFDVSVQIDLTNIPDNWEEVVRKCGLLKRNCFAAVFEKYFEFQVGAIVQCPVSPARLCTSKKSFCSWSRLSFSLVGYVKFISLDLWVGFFNCCYNCLTWARNYKVKKDCVINRH